MRIATFNANSIRMRLPVILEWLQKHNPDVLAVQETKVQDKDFPVKDITEAGYHVVFQGQKSYNGVAILSREPLKQVKIGFEDASEGSRIIRGEYKGIHIINTYVPQGRDIESPHYQLKLEWLKKLHGLLEREYQNTEPVIWLGDINIAPEARDVHDPVKLDGHVCFNRELSALFRKICAWGLVDVFRKFHPESGLYTFFDYRVRGAVARKIGWRIDTITVTEPLARVATDAWIDLEPRKSKRFKPSDHTFLVAEFAV